MENKNKGCFKKIIIAIGIFFLLMVIIAIFTPESTSDSNAKQEETENISFKTENENINKSNWKYSQSSSEMDDTKFYFAKNKSLNELEFEFPYGTTDFTLTIRYNDSNNKTDIMLSGESCQFLSSFGTEYVRLKFDDKEAFNVHYTEPEDISLGLIFLQSQKKIISNIKTAKELKIEAPFFQAGRQVIKFNIENFEWEH